MIIGIDFDNTIVSYDNVFFEVAKEIIGKDSPTSKNEIREYLQSRGNNDLWTEIQGIVYGREILKAKAFPGVEDFIKKMRNRGHKIFVVSHKTLYPFIGEKHNLHEAAKNWLKANHFTDIINDAFFETSQDLKLKRIQKLACDIFIDDLPEFLLREDFPKIKKILFDPNDYNAKLDLVRVNSWDEVEGLLASRSDYMESEQFKQDVAKLMKQVGVNKFEMESIKGHGNNRIYKIGKYKLKAYFRHPDDPRDRLGAEYSFCEFAHKHGITNLQKPVVKDDENGLGVYEFIDGKKPAEQTEARIQECIDFFKAINKFKADGKNLPKAAEGCFTLQEHFNTVDRRLNNLLKINTDSEIDKQALEFVKEMKEFWEDFKRNLNIDNFELTEEQKVVSPSDFGFHNAILSNDKLIFIDFEYAGWDDAIKFICDFFCHPGQNVPMKYYEIFRDQITNETKRCNKLFPVHKIKWSCIMLNEFLKFGEDRSKFTNSERTKEVQLEKARKNLESAKELIKQMN